MRHSIRFNHQLALRIKQALSSIIENAEPVPAAASSSGPRLRMSSVLTHQWDSAFLHLGGGAGVRNIVAIVDMSGSMSGMWHSLGGAEFVWALCLLAREGTINLRVFLTGNHRAEMPVTIPFGMFCMLSPRDGVEGFRITLKNPVVAPLLQPADCVLCWTDGQLVDGHINALEWRALGVHLIGATIAHPKSPTTVVIDGGHKETTIEEAMQLHFHSSFADPNPVNLANRIGTYLVSREPKELQ